MRCRGNRVLGLGLLLAVVGAAPGRAAVPEPAPQRLAAARVPCEAFPAPLRDAIRQVLEQPTLFTQGPPELFTCCPALYYWLLDHPDRASRGWRRLGAKCLEISGRGEGRFGCADGRGTDVCWETVCDSPQMRVWYAQGVARPGLLLPPVTVRAVVVLRYAERRDAAGRLQMHHQADLFLKTDSQAVALVARLVGSSAPQLAEQAVAQLQMFFSALAWYLDQHPERIEALLCGEK
jgi:hypothetical protein